ncbi:hypothetical protein PMZ80_007548 [Knufia obscura]|uniref:Uncharacterized protein n=2 Tax=Knufia TaxID=430999 RepID=A0AAN8EQZ3_9EURO|nr:hypothetical protein PMZ80_007548 [Knufia obscura]KAK5954090.1 hypothetical protein OHC33_004661 [Knufia fluminis]
MSNTPDTPNWHSDQPLISVHTKRFVLQSHISDETKEAFRGNVVRDATWDDYPKKRPEFDHKVHRRIIKELLRKSSRDGSEDFNQIAVMSYLGDVGHRLGFLVPLLICAPFKNDDLISEQREKEIIIEAGFVKEQDGSAKRASAGSQH